MPSPSIRNPHVRPPAIRWNQGDTLPPVDATGNAAPLLVDAFTGRLMVDALTASSADLSILQNDFTASNALLTSAVADLDAIKNNTATMGGGGGGGGSSSVTLSGVGAGVTLPVSGSMNRAWNLATSTDSLTAAISSLPAVSLASGQSLTSALANGQTLTAALANGSTLSSSISNFPAIQNVSLVGDSLTAIPASLTAAVSLAGNQTLTSALANGSTLLAYGGDLLSGNQKTQIINGSNTLTVDSLGATTANQPSVTTTAYTLTGGASAGTVLIGPVNCSAAREAHLFIYALPTLSSIIVEISPDNSTWFTAWTNYLSPTSTSTNWGNTQYSFNNAGANSVWLINLAGASFIRVKVASGATLAAGTTNIQLSLQSSVGPTNQTTSYIINSVGVSALPSNSEIRIAASFTRPANTTAYASGKLVANNVTAGSVTPLTFTNAVRTSGDCVRIERVRIAKSGTSLTNASFRVHLFEASPTVTVGDGTAFNASGVLSCNSVLYYAGSFVTALSNSGSDGAIGIALPDYGSGVTVSPTSGTSLYGLIEALAAYTPVSAETFTVTIEGYRV